MKRYLWLLLFFALGGVVIGYRQLSTRITDGSWFAADDVSVATVVQAKRKTPLSVVLGSGKLQPVSEVDVVPRVPGRIIEIRPKVGDRVTQGQLLAISRSDELLERKKSVEAILEAARADLAQKEIQLAVAEKELERTRELLEKDLIARRDVKEAEASTDSARAQQERAQAQVAEQQAALEQTRYLLELSKLLAAPISGVVIRRLVEPGVYVGASTPVLVVASLDPLKVMFNISETERYSIREGVPAQIRVDVLPGRVFEGRVAVLHPQSETTRTVVAEIELSNPAHVLAPGMSVEVALTESNQ
jgi:RND family efflux transporter MFP subunit